MRECIIRKKKTKHILKKKRSIYETATPDDVFAEVKNKAKQYWIDNFENTHGYVTGKIERIDRIENHDDDYLFILKMFDPQHEKKCILSMSQEAREWIKKSKIAKGYIELGKYEEYEKDKKWEDSSTMEDIWM